jgi:hypothetical protein
MSETTDSIPEVMLMLSSFGGVRPEPNDPGLMGWLADAVGGNVRVFPSGGLWQALLAALRATVATHGMGPRRTVGGE